MKRLTGRSWAFVVYPDSLPLNYEEIITSTGLPMAFSPLHDKDIDPTGEIKKAHYHVILYYENTTTFNNVKTNVTEKLNGTIPIKLESLYGMYRYHLHLDNPDKFQYDDRDRRFFNGFDVSYASSLTKTEINKLIRSIQSFIRDNDIYEYSDLLDTLLDSDCLNLHEIASSHTLFFKSYLDSRRYKLEHSSKK